MLSRSTQNFEKNLSYGAVIGGSKYRLLYAKNGVTWKEGVATEGGDVGLGGDKNETWISTFSLLGFTFSSGRLRQ
jgi:hypothetical protein